MFPEYYSLSFCLLIFLPIVSICLFVNILKSSYFSSYFIEIVWIPSESCVLPFCLSVFSPFCADLSLINHLSLYSFILVHWNMPEQTQHQ